jgi:hypothetical protein
MGRTWGADRCAGVIELASPTFKASAVGDEQTLVWGKEREGCKLLQALRRAADD